MKKKELLTVKELAAELRMSPKSTHCVCRKGEIPLEVSVCSLIVAPGYI